LNEPVDDDQVVLETLRQTEERVAALESSSGARLQALNDGQKALSALKRRRQRGLSSSWDPAQRAALRLVLMSIGCVSTITGAMSLDETLGAAAIVLAFGVLVFEGSK
jgi:hypothetical protein